MINKILVATDASAASARAVSFAARLSVQHESELLILNVIRDMQVPQILRDDPEFESFYNSRDELMRQAADLILKEARQLAKKEGVTNVQTAMASRMCKRRSAVATPPPAWPVSRVGVTLT